jgi:hypothetical protein
VTASAFIFELVEVFALKKPMLVATRLEIPTRFASAPMAAGVSRVEESPARRHRLRLLPENQCDAPVSEFACEFNRQHPAVVLPSAYHRQIAKS